MSLPLIFGALALLLLGVLVASTRGRASGAGRQSVVIVVLLVATAGLVLFYLFGR